jgi:hemerythrin superfamily protein
MTATHTATHIATPHRAAHAQKDAIAMLEADHEAVDRLFDEYETTRSVSDKKALVSEICTSLTVHMQVEEEIFYPAVRSAMDNGQRVSEATVEHAGVLELIRQLANARHDGEVYDAKVKVLSEYVRHHVEEERTGIFPQARASPIDMSELGFRMAARQASLLSQTL